MEALEKKVEEKVEETKKEVTRQEMFHALNERIAEIKADGRLAKWIAEYTAEADSLKDK